LRTFKSEKTRKNIKYFVGDICFDWQFIVVAVFTEIVMSLSKLQSEQTATLKKLVESNMCDSSSTGVKLVFGKEFKLMVDKGLFEGLLVGNKKSNNEPQYNYLL
jgi:hypothetical protein